MSTYPDHILRVGSQHLAELKRKAAEFERQLWDAHDSLEQELEQSVADAEAAEEQQEAFRWAAEAAAADEQPDAFRWAAEAAAADRQQEALRRAAEAAAADEQQEASPWADQAAAADEQQEPFRWAAEAAAASEQQEAFRGAAEAAAASEQQKGPRRAAEADEQQEAFRWAADAAAGREADGKAQLDLAPTPSDVEVDAARRTDSPHERTAQLIGQGRKPPKPTHPGRKVVLIALAIGVTAALITWLVVTITRPGPSWPGTVATVQREIATACQNPDVRSEPSLVNFACNKNTRQILWVFSLMTSGNNPDFASIRTGRQGLVPIKPAQGGQVAWSLNLHHPYDPANPIDSLQVAARAINNIIGGATLTAANGKPAVQPGLESVAANCARYTGSAAVTSRAGYPPLCARPIAGKAGQAYLVADVFEKWMVGAPPSAAQDAAVLFLNANNPGDPRVRAILQSLQRSRLSG